MFDRFLSPVGAVSVDRCWSIQYVWRASEFVAPICNAAVVAPDMAAAIGRLRDSLDEDIEIVDCRMGPPVSEVVIEE